MYDNKTTLELYKSFKRKKFACLLGKWLSVISPFIVIGIVNFNDYFTEYNGTKMSIGCILACLVGGYAIYCQAKDTDKKIASVIKWGIAFGLVYFFSSILNDLVLIVGCGFAGQVVGTGFDVGYDVYKEKTQLVLNAGLNGKAINEK